MQRLISSSQFDLTPFGRPKPPFTINWDSWQARGLIAWYPLIPVDAAPNLAAHKHFRLNNTGAVWVADPVMGRVPQFVNDGSNDRFDLQSIVWPFPITPLTMCVWFNTTDIDGSGTLFEFGSGNSDSYRLQTAGGVAGDPVSFRANISGGSNALTSTGYSANTWHHACGLARSITDRSAYIDGGSRGNNAVSRDVSAATQLRIGLRFNGGQDFDGTIADVRIYNRALSDPEVFALWDPRTRWDLYQPIRRRTFTAAAGVTRTPPVGSVALTGNAGLMDFGVIVPTEV